MGMFRRARMVGNVALRGVSYYGGNLPKPATVVMAYTGQSSYSSDFPPAFITVSADDPIADAATVDGRVRNLKSAGVEVEYRRFKNAGHGFGLGVGTDAQGWAGHAIEFWRKHISEAGLQAAKQSDRNKCSPATVRHAPSKKH